MDSLDNAIIDAQNTLNSAYQSYIDAGSKNQNEFDEIKLQAAIFNYELCKEVTFFYKKKPIGFSQKVALKGAIHCIYEYKRASDNLLMRIFALAKLNKIEIFDADLRKVKLNIKPHLKSISNWEDIRNKATAHYDKNTTAQFSVINQIDVDEALEVMKYFLMYSVEILKILKIVGASTST